MVCIIIIRPIDCNVIHHTFQKAIQSNLSYPGTLGLGGARNSDLSVSQNTIEIHRL